MQILQFTEKQLKFGELISRILYEQRTKEDIPSGKLGHYLGGIWKLNPPSASQYLRENEKYPRNVVDKIVNSIETDYRYRGLKEFPVRFADQIRAINVDDEDLKRIQEYIHEIHPGFVLLESNIDTYHSFMKSLSSQFAEKGMINSEILLPSFYTMEGLVGSGLIGIINSYKPTNNNI